jgi:hypothetical protein
MKAVQARVGLMRSSDTTVHLKVDGDTDGRAEVNEHGFAIAAAAHEAGKSVWLTYAGFTPPKGTGEVGGFSDVEIGTDDWTT